MRCGRVPRRQAFIRLTMRYVAHRVHYLLSGGVVLQEGTVFSNKNNVRASYPRGNHQVVLGKNDNDIMEYVSACTCDPA